MGKVIHFSSYSPIKQEGILKPIIYCYTPPTIEDKALSLNQELSQELNNIQQNKRTIQLAHIFEKIIKNKPDDTVIKDFDVLFNPAYRIDIMKIMIAVCKIKPFSIIWPGGTYENGYLIYAEYGYPDFKRFHVKEYDITCIIA